MVSSVSSLNSQIGLSLLSAIASGSTTNESSALLSYYQAKEGGAASSSGASAATVPTAPWNTTSKTSVSATVRNAVDGTAFINPSAATLNAPAGTSTGDYKNLFALYQGLNTLKDLAATAATDYAATGTTPSITTAQLQSAFASGMSQVSSFLANDPFKKFNVTAGKVSTTESSNIGIPNGSSTSYTTGVIGTGDRESPIAALEGDVQFNISVTGEYTNGVTNVPINLANMAGARTMDNVVDYINEQLSAAGLGTTFSVADLGPSTTTSTVNGKTTTTTGAEQWGLTVNGVSAEEVSFSAPSTAASLYVGETTGGAPTASTTKTSSSTATPPTGQALIKLQASNASAGANVTNTSTLPVSGVFSQALPSGVTSVAASATASDGSVYLLANVQGSVNGTPVPGQQGVALLKYDAAGKLVSTKVLPGEQDATGDSLAISSTGSIAVAGTNVTPASTAANGITTAGTTSAFVQVFDPTGAPLFSGSVPATGGTATATGVTFGSDGSVYLSGTTTGSVGDQRPQGTSDEFIQGFAATTNTNTGAVTYAPSFTSQFGAPGGVNTSGGIAYDAANNALYTVGSDNSQAVVRSFTLNGTAAPTLAATRTLGAVDNVAGIAITNGQVVVGGTTAASTINVANVGQAFTGVTDGFVASISAGLTALPTDTVSYIGKTGASITGTALAAANGQAYLTGTVANDPNNVSSTDATEGFVADVDTTTGAQSYAATFTAANGQAAPSTIAVGASGVSVLDQLGLPNGSIYNPTSQLITANTAIAAGSSFYVKTSPNGAQTAIAITATDTLATLATKLNAALGAAGTATVQTVGAKSELEITPTNASSYIELDDRPSAATAATQLATSGSSPASSSSDVLESLGLSVGVVRTVKQVNGVTDPSQLREYGLKLPAGLTIDNAADAQTAMTALEGAIGVLQQAYQDLVSPPTVAAEEAAKESSSGGGSVPKYLQNEISNYTAGLQRLESGSTSSTTIA